MVLDLQIAQRLGLVHPRRDQVGTIAMLLLDQLHGRCRPAASRCGVDGRVNLTHPPVEVRHDASLYRDPGVGPDCMIGRREITSEGVLEVRSLRDGAAALVGCEGKRLVDR